MSNSEDRIWQEIAANSNWSKNQTTAVQSDPSNQPVPGLAEALPKPGFWKAASREGFGGIQRVYETCGFCHDEGVIVREGIQVELFEGQAIFLEFPSRRACLYCRK